jgi:Ca-activated chloride channel family protein
MQALKFAHPWILHGLWGIPLLIAFIWYVARQKQQLFRRFGQVELVKRLMPGFRKSRLIWKSILMLLAYASLIVALADPQLGTRMEDVKREGVDLIVALDVSLSMKAEDVSPNRLEKAKHEVAELIDILQGDRIGLIAFAGIAHVQCPLTLDYSAAKLFLDMMDTNLLPVPGTAVGDAIDRAIKAFNQKERKHKALILITDGEDHDSEPIKKAEEAAQQGIVIYTIGIGSPQGVPIPVYDEYGRAAGYKKDRDGNVVTTKLDVTTLQKIAFLTNGKYYISSSGETELEEIYKEISQLEKKELTSRQFAQYEDRFQIFILLAIIFLMLEILLPERNREKSSF